MSSRGKKIALGAVIVLIATAGALAVVLQTSALLETARVQVENIASDALQGTVKIGAIDGSLVTGLEVSNVELIAPDGSRIAHIPRADASIGFADLLGRGVSVTVQAQDAYVFIRRDEAGGINLLDALPPESDEPSSPLPVWLDLKFSVRDSVVLWRDEGADAAADDPLAALTDVSTAEQGRDAAALVEPAESPPRAAPRNVVLTNVTTNVRVVLTRAEQTRVSIEGLTASVASPLSGASRKVTAQDAFVAMEADGVTEVTVGSLVVDQWLEVERFGLVLPSELALVSARADDLVLSQAALQFAVPEASLRTGITAQLQVAPDPEGRLSVLANVKPGEFQPLVLTALISDWLEPGPTTEWSATLRAPEVRAAEVSAAAHPLFSMGAYVEATGTGIDPETLSATARVGVENVEVDRFKVQSGYVEAVYAERRLTVRESFVNTPYANATVRASYGLDGTFEVAARSKSTELVKKVAAILFEQDVDTRADVELHASGRVDLEQEDPATMLRGLSAELNWDVQAFVAEDVRVERSRGDLTARYDGDGGPATFDVRAKASAQNIKAVGLKLRALRADLKADSKIDVANPDVMALARGLTARLDLDVDGLVADGAVVRDIDLLTTLSPAGGRTRYDVRGSASRIVAGDVRIADAAAKLKGTLRLGDVPQWPKVLREISAKGNVSARGVDAQGDAAATLDADIDIAGPIADLKGTVKARTTDLVAGDYAFTSLAATVSFVGGRNFEVDAQGLQKDRVPEQLGVFVRGRYNRDLTDFQVLELRFTSAGEAWTLTDGFSFDAGSGTVRFNDVTLSQQDQRVRITGSFTQGRGQDLRAEVERFDLSSLASDFGLRSLAPLRGRVDMKAEVAGTSADPTARFDVHITDLFWEEFGPFEVRAEGRYGERELVVESMSVDGYSLRLVQGNALLPVRITTAGEFEVLQSNNIEVFLETPQFNPNKLHAAVPALSEWGVDGQVEMTTRLGGTLENPSLNVAVKSAGVTASPLIDSDRVTIGPLDGSATARYSDPGEQNGGFEVGINAAFPDQPPVQILARIQADAASWARQTLDGKEIDWTAELKSAPWRFIGKAEQFDLKNLRVGAMREADVEGKVSINVIGDGTLAAPKANIEIKLADFGWERYRDVFFDADLGIEKDRLVLKSSRLEWDASEILTAKGTIPAPFEAVFGNAPLADLPIDFEAQLQPTKLSKLSAVDYAFASLTGNARGTMRFGGTLSRPTADTRFALDGITFSDGSNGGVAINASLGANDDFKGGFVWTRAGKPSLVGKISAPLQVNLIKVFNGEAIDLTSNFEAELKGDAVPLASLLPQRFFDRYVKRVKGELSTDLKITGTIDKPVFDGRLRVTEGALTLTEYSREFDRVALDVTATPGNGLTLQDFHVKGERGYISAQGNLEIDGWRPGVVDGNIEVREFGTAGFADLAMYVWADVVLDGDFASSPASAKATVSELEIVVPDSSDLTTHATGLDEDIVIIRNETDRQKLYAVEGTIEPVSTEPYAALNIVVEPGGRVRHPLAQVEIGGDLKLQLSDAGPTIRGEVTTRRGTAQFLGKRFVIQQGIVTFTGNDPPDPRLQVEAAYTLDRNLTRQIGQATSGEPRAIVRITGRATDPRIRFLSDPAMSESDVIYVLLTNRPPGQGEVGETGLATGAASGLLTGIIADSPVGKVFDVRVEAGEQGFSDASIEVGRYITPTVFVSVDLKSGAKSDENTSELNIEYRFLPRWIFEFEAGNRGTGEANIFWDIY